MKAISAITATLSILSIGILLSAQAAQAAQSTEPKFISGSVKQTTTMDGLTSKVQWKQAAQGVWLTEIGDMSKELRYTDLAAEAPRLERINKLSKQDFPFKEGDIKTTINPDGRIMIRIPCGPDEKLYGYGLQLDKLNQTSRVLTLNVDHWGKGGGRTHAPAPFYISSKGYGVFFNTARYLKVYNQISNRKDATQRPPEVDRNPPKDEKASQPGPWQAQPQGDSVEAAISAKGMEVILFAGNSMLEVVQRYNLYAGGGALPPLWGLGFWNRVHAHYSADQVEQEVAAFEKNKFPLDVIGLEPGWMSKSYPCTFEWQKKRFPDPEKLTRSLLKKGIRLNLWENPYISQKAKIYKDMYALSGSHMVWLGIVPDYTLPEARKIITDQHFKDHVSIGISGYKMDEVDGYDRWLWPDHATFPSGTSAEAMRQTYGMQLQKMLYQDLFKKNNTRTYSLVRASNGAASGYPFVIYSDSYNHEQYITGLSTASICGLLWTPEIRSAGSAREWLNRMQTTCFSPMANLNAWSSGMKPWGYPEVTDAVRDVIELRMRLLPYLYTAFADYNQNGVPPIRAMILEGGFEEGDKTVIEGKLDSETNPYAVGKIIEKNDQFMFGPSIMVAPFYGKQAIKRSVQLPAGNWYDFYTGKLVGNNTTITVTAKDLKDSTPLFVKEGSVIPMFAKAPVNSQAAQGQDIIVRHYGKKAGRCALYEDDAKTFDYQNGSHRTRHISISTDGKPTVHIKGDGPSLFGKIITIKQMTQ
jgi:alpha-glucosidase (family GH31 glycosyl hydrolase)